MKTARATGRKGIRPQKKRPGSVSVTQSSVPKLSRRQLSALMAAHQRRIDGRRRQWADEESAFRDLVARNAGAGAWDRFAGLLGQTGQGRRELMDMAASTGRPRRIAAKYDAAQTVDDNRVHWSMADGLSADAANSPGVRAILRSRSRYEIANNCYAAGVGLTIANDFCGTGPRLNLSTDSEAINSQVEKLFAAWARAVNLARILRTMRMARRQDGEAFGLMVSNPGIEDAVKLGIRLIEADQVSSFDAANQANRIDGLHFDDHGNPIAYDILREHPGGLSGGTLKYDTWNRRNVIHWFRPSRVGQHRGIPEIVPALPLYATLRRYTQATLDAAESAADMAVLLQTQSAAEFRDENGEEQAAEAAAAFATLPFSRRMFVALPQGYEAKQMQAEQPTQQYSNFKREIAGEIGRCENVSRNVVLLDSSESNFASGQLDHRVTYRTHDIDREDCSIEVLDRIFRAWLDEASLISGYLPQPLRARGVIVPHTWHWDSNELGDPVKLAKAKQINLSSGLTSLPAEYAAKGQDWIKALELAARGLGISVQELQALIRKSVFGQGQGQGDGKDGQDGEEEDQEEQAKPPRSAQESNK